MTSNDVRTNRSRGSSRGFPWFVAALCLTTATALLLTLVRPDWIERALGVDPDRGSGATELLLVVSLAAATVGLCRLWAARKYNRPADGPAED